MTENTRGCQSCVEMDIYQRRLAAYNRPSSYATHSAFSAANAVLLHKTNLLEMILTLEAGLPSPMPSNDHSGLLHWRNEITELVIGTSSSASTHWDNMMQCVCRTWLGVYLETGPKLWTVKSAVSWSRMQGMFPRSHNLSIGNIVAIDIPCESLPLINHWMELQNYCTSGKLKQVVVRTNNLRTLSHGADNVTMHIVHKIISASDNLVIVNPMSDHGILEHDGAGGGGALSLTRIMQSSPSCTCLPIVTTQVVKLRLQEGFYRMQCLVNIVKFTPAVKELTIVTTSSRPPHYHTTSLSDEVDLAEQSLRRLCIGIETLVIDGLQGPDPHLVSLLCRDNQLNMDLFNPHLQITYRPAILQGVTRVRIVGPAWPEYHGWMRMPSVKTLHIVELPCTNIWEQPARHTDRETSPLNIIQGFPGVERVVLLADRRDAIVGIDWPMIDVLANVITARNCFGRIIKHLHELQQGVHLVVSKTIADQHYLSFENTVDGGVTQLDVDLEQKGLGKCIRLTVDRSGFSDLWMSERKCCESRSQQGGSRVTLVVLPDDSEPQEDDDEDSQAIATKRWFSVCRACVSGKIK